MIIKRGYLTIVTFLFVIPNLVIAQTGPSPGKTGLSTNLIFGVVSGYNDNLFLDANNKQRVYLQRFEPHFYLDYSTRKIKLTLDYSGDYRWYNRESERLKNLLHYTKLNASWNIHRDFKFQVSGDVSEQPVDLSKGGGISAASLVLGNFFRPPAANSVLSKTAGATSQYYRQLNNSTFLRVSYTVRKTIMEEGKGQDFFSSGPALEVINTWSKRFSTVLRVSFNVQDYEGNTSRGIDQYLFRFNYNISPALSFRSGLGIERLEIKQLGAESINSSNLYLDLGIKIAKATRSSLNVDYKRNIILDIQGQAYSINDLGVSYYHGLTRRLQVVAGMYSRYLDYLETDLIEDDWITGLEGRLVYSLSRDIKPELKINYVINRGNMQENDFYNCRYTIGLRYYLLSMN